MRFFNQIYCVLKDGKIIEAVAGDKGFFIPIAMWNDLQEVYLMQSCKHMWC